MHARVRRSLLSGPGAEREELVKRLQATLLGAALATAITPRASAQASPPPPPQDLPPVTITGTRERELLSETPASVGVIGEEAIRRTAPTHPQQILSQVPGVAVAVTNGEGHATAIRQPFTTSPLYLFLEDGLSIHSAPLSIGAPTVSSVGQCSRRRGRSKRCKKNVSFGDPPNQ